MIRADVTTPDGEPVMMLGLTLENIRRLVGGEHVEVPGESVGIPGLHSVVLWAGDDDADLVDRLDPDMVAPGSTFTIAGENVARIILEDAPPPPVKVEWASRTERLTANVDHGMLVVPHGEDEHKVYYFGDVERVGEMIASALAFAARWNDGIALKVAKEHLANGKATDLRGLGL